jgi:hypothetical protein
VKLEDHNGRKFTLTKLVDFQYQKDGNWNTKEEDAW